MADFTSEFSGSSPESGPLGAIFAETLVPETLQEAPPLAIGGEQVAGGGAGVPLGFNAFNTGIQKR